MRSQSVLLSLLAGFVVVSPTSFSGGPPLRVLATEGDADGDRIPDASDNCPTTANPA